MKTVIGISLVQKARTFDFRTRFLGEELHVQRLGTDGSTAQAAKLLRLWDKKADASGWAWSRTAAARAGAARSTPPS